MKINTLGMAGNSIKNYLSVVGTFTKLYGENIQEITFDDVLEYIAILKNKKQAYSTIKAHVAHINRLLLDNGNTVLENNKRFLSANFKDLGREIGTQQNQAPEISQEKLREVLSSIGNDESENTRTFYAKECKNFFILMYYGAFRVSELLDIRIENIEAVSNAHFTGAVIKLDGSKTNQTKEYEAKSIPITDTEFCPYKALFAQIGNRKSGYLFGGEEKYYEVLVNRRIKKYFGEEYTSHSFRVSFVTHSKEAGASDFEIQKQTGHKTVAMIARYTRKTDVHINNSVNKLKL